MNSAPPGPYAGIPRWLRPITRRPGEVQFGVIEGGPIVTGVTPDEARLLGRLDGSLPADALGAVAKASGISKRRWRVLLDLVVRLGLLEPAPDPPALAALPDGLASPDAPAHVLIEGGAALARELARLLGPHAFETGATPASADAAVSAASAVSPAASGASDASGGGGIPLAATGAVRWAATSAAPGPFEREAAPPSAVVLVADIALDPRRGDVWLQRGVPHLPVVTTGARAVVGPLIDGGPGAPCLWCLDLHRSDRDEAWPTVMAQVAALPDDHDTLRVGAEAGQARAHPGEPGLAQLVAGTVAALVARAVAGERPPPGVAVEVSLPWPRLDHRRWRPHPRCHRHAFVRAAPPPGTARAGEAGIA